MDVYAQLSAQRSVDRPETAARVALASRNPAAEFPRYLASLKGALWEEYPPFATELYEEMYVHASASGQWLAMSLMTNAQREGIRARRLWELAASCCTDGPEQKLLKQHACDKSNHSRAYLELLDLVFPGAVQPEFRSELNQLSPGFSIEQELPAPDQVEHDSAPSLNEFMNLNLDEIRTTIHRALQRRTLPAHASAENLPHATRTLDSLLADGLNHIAYTAEIIERKSGGRSADELQTFFCKSLRDFNRSNSEEPIEYSYNQRFGNYP